MLKTYLSTSDFRKKHNNSNTFASSKYCNFLQHALRLGVHLVCIHNLPDLIWWSFEWKQDIWRLFSATSTHKIYAVDVTDRNVTLSRTVKIQGSTCATTLHLRGLVYHGGFHLTCWIIDESGNIWFYDGMTTGRITVKEGRFGSVSWPDLKKCRNKQLCLVIYGHKSWLIQKTLNCFIPSCSFNFISCYIQNKAKDSFLPCEALALFQ